jgi:alkylhydroperoxidase/carboxymuconolactone decarboxylase family protein YurZ
MSTPAKTPTPVEYLRLHNAAAADAFVALRNAAVSGPLDAHTCELVVLGSLVVTGNEGSFKVHARRLLRDGVAADALRQAAMVTMAATTTFGQVIAALKWIDAVCAEA